MTKNLDCPLIKISKISEFIFYQRITIKYNHNQQIDISNIIKTISYMFELRETIKYPNQLYHINALRL